ncbi:MAG: transposase [Deltaproteobacteria bacterium]|nr:transposase [Deltaproteobacteria bacterium]
MSNRKYTEEFKEEAIRLMQVRDESVSAISEKLGVTKNTLYKWNKRSKMGFIEGNKEGLIKENTRLIKALKLAEEERDILKKAVAYFAKRSQ